MKARPLHSKQSGQSIVIIALIIVVLVGMVGLSVDVGNDYAENRNAVRATNAAALAAMDKLIQGGADPDIGSVIVASFKSNGITAQIDAAAAPAPGERRILARYLDSNGNQIGTCNIGNCGSVPANVAYIQINTKGTVDTYFARVLGQTTLPVNAQAFAAQCTPVNGVYPIGVNASDLDSNGFKPPSDPTEMKYYGYYSDNVYQNKTQRRIFRKSTFGTPGSFDWMQWSSDPNAGSQVSTGAMLTGDGNLDLRFDEVVPWPNPNMKAPDGYPQLPHRLSDGDWIHGNTGSTNSTDVTAALDYHIKNRTILNLPIIDEAVGTGQNTSFHVQRLGAFYLRGYSLAGGGNSYFDLVYLGKADKKACLNTNVNQGLKGLGLVGQVYVNPRWPLQAGAQPVAYQIVLDVSGSMSWDFNGYGTYDGSNSGSGGIYQTPSNIKGDVQCESTKNPNPSGFPFTDRCIGGTNSAWKNQNERRIYIAKQAILNFIDRMRPDDTMRVIAFSSSQSGGAASGSDWSSDKAQLRNTVMQAGSLGSDPYKTDGGTPGPQALDKARKLFQVSNGYNPTAPNGEKYKPVVIYVTDGVANIFLNGNYNDARDVCGNLSVAEARSTADPCQIGQTDPPNSKLRPISAMIDIAHNMRAGMPNLEIYAIGLAQVPEAGLPKVANDRSYYYPATKANVVESILTSVQARATGATCTSGGGFNWVNYIGSANTPEGLPSGVYGYAYIYDQTSTSTPKYTLPIRLDTSAALNGRLGFVIPPPDPNNPASTGVTPGLYQMKAYVGYKGPDGVTRVYNYFNSMSSLQETESIPITVSSAATLGSSVSLDPIYLDLDPAKVVCPTTP